ncbi:hypothetical protein C6P46_004638 [Rhodotorula mucilaginosa]|uniref:Uncharacterized protein n=1 Tax=Rhodotorula mucilaginosa TaxID=5537 RepID=A0A9P6W0B3_RHOMI|nr:hypothetical protein C6P46_004638 [Rhodotorula mucilaginosa]TKA54014.1 hypothetical protein B0A53_03296 [Rhodotorula sp. CCFEE 5036]
MVRTRSRAHHSPAAPLDPPAPAVNEPVEVAPSRSSATSPSTTSTAAPTTTTPSPATNNKRKASKAPTGAKPKLRKAPRGQSPDRDETGDNDDGEGDSVLVRRIGQKFSPGDGQLDYTITAPLPKRDPVSREFIFEDYPRFRPNLSPEEIIRRGSFDGGFFRPVKSKQSGRELHEDWADLPKEWYSGLSSGMYLTRPEGAEDSVNKWQARMGQPYEAWEANGWIRAEHDARGWFQWYYRFFLGRRCEDDDRQVGRWDRVAGEASGRWRRILLQKYRQKGVSFVEPNEEEVSPGIRQTLQHWGYDPTTEALNRFREEKGDNVANEDADEQ